MIQIFFRNSQIIIQIRYGNATRLVISIDDVVNRNICEMSTWKQCLNKTSIKNLFNIWISLYQRINGNTGHHGCDRWMLNKLDDR